MLHREQTNTSEHLIYYVSPMKYLSDSSCVLGLHAKIHLTDLQGATTITSSVSVDELVGLWTVLGF